MRMPLKGGAPSRSLASLLTAINAGRGTEQHQDKDGVREGDGDGDGDVDVDCSIGSAVLVQCINKEALAGN